LDDLAFPPRDELASRLRDLATRTASSRGSFDDLELKHLLDVATNHALLVAEVYRGEKLDRVIAWEPSSTHVLLGATAGQLEPSADVIRQFRRIPDEIKLVGDKCLYDVGMVGVHEHHGHDLKLLGQRSYMLASELLQLLSDDRRLREFFQQNRMMNLPIEEEIVFLRQCGARFTVHAELLRDLGIFEDSSPAHSSTNDARATREEIILRLRPIQRNQNPNSSSDIPSKNAGSADKSGSFTPRRPGEQVPPMTEASGFETFNQPFGERGFSGVMEGHPEVSLEDLRPHPAMADMDRLPRKDLLSLYERMLLFSGLDIESMRADLKRMVIDQEGAVNSLCDELSLYATGTQSLTRPASYFFVGPTGVGKNHMMESMVKALEARWDIRIPVLQLEGPQYTYPSDINELKGAARGFIRSDEEGILTEFYGRSSQSPFSVILVDEVEKSHPQLRKFFLSLMDRGTTMDNRGQTLNFINTMIIYTSNIGYSRLQGSANLIGFNEEEDQQQHRDHEVMRDLKKTLSPEFVNRLTVIKFSPLSMGSIEAIFELEFEKIASRYMAMHGLELTVTPRARVELIRLGYSPEFGARPMGRLLNTVCNIEVSKKLRRDDGRSTMADRTLRDYIREVKEGKRAYDPVAMQRRVVSTARMQVPYTGVAIDFDGGEFLYLPQGKERGSH